MARQKGILTLEGKAGTLSFYQGRDGFAARQSSGMNGKRIFEDPAFIRTRENGIEFGRAGKAGKLLRTALRTFLLNVADTRVTGRLTREMLKVVQSDPVNGRGERTAGNGDASILNGFEFNIKNPLAQTVFVPFEASIDRNSRTGSVALPAFTPQKFLAAPKGASHYCLLLGIVSADFDGEQTVQTLWTSEPLELTLAEVPAATHSVTLPETAEMPLLLAFGVEFVQVVNGQRYSLNNAEHNALSVVAVDSLLG